MGAGWVKPASFFMKNWSNFGLVQSMMDRLNKSGTKYDKVCFVKATNSLLALLGLAEDVAVAVPDLQDGGFCTVTGTELDYCVDGTVKINWDNGFVLLDRHTGKELVVPKEVSV